MIQRRTQTGTYWQQQFTLSGKDVQFVLDLILDAGRPMGEALLARRLIERHVKQEEETIRAELSKGVVYQPQNTYPAGEDLIFPALDYAHGTVVGTRLGRNPDYGEFTVIQVRFDGENDIREFASDLRGEHALQRGDDDEDAEGKQEGRETGARRNHGRRFSEYAQMAVRFARSTFDDPVSKVFTPCLIFSTILPRLSAKPGRSLPWP